MGRRGDSSQTFPQKDTSGEEKHLELPASALHLPPQRPPAETISHGLQTLHWIMHPPRTQRGQEGTEQLVAQGLGELTWLCSEHIVSSYRGGRTPIRL